VILPPLSGMSTSGIPRRPSRASIVPSELLRRLDINDMPPPSKAPLLTFKLSHSSFLDAHVKDDLSRSPLYHISTQCSTTTITRSDPWDGPTTTAAIRWSPSPKSKGKGRDIDGVQISIRQGRWKPVDEFLRPSSVLRSVVLLFLSFGAYHLLFSSSPSKFKIPGYSHALKWKAVGTSFWVRSNLLPFLYGC